MRFNPVDPPPQDGNPAWRGYKGINGKQKAFVYGRWLSKKAKIKETFSGNATIWLKQVCIVVKIRCICKFVGSLHKRSV